MRGLPPVRTVFLNNRLTDRGGAHRWLLDVLAHREGRFESLLLVGDIDPRLPSAEAERAGPVEIIDGLGGGGLGREVPASTLSALGRVIEAFAPDTVFVNDIVAPSVLELVASTGRGVMMVQDHRSFCPGRGKVDLDDVICRDPMGASCSRCFDDDGYFQRILALTRARIGALMGFRGLLTLSRYMRDELAQAGVASERIQVVPPFVGMSAPTRTGPGDYHLMAGRLARHKGTRVALAAIDACRGELPLVVAGSASRQGAEDLRMAPDADAGKIRMEGWCDRRRMGELLQGARSLWLPSLWGEPFGIVGLEALAAGVPVIASQVGGIPEWLEHGVTGVLIAPDSPSALAEAADELAAHPELAMRLGAAGREAVASRFDPDQQVDALVRALAHSFG